MRTSRKKKKKNSKHTLLWENTQAVQPYRCLKPNIGFWKLHTFNHTLRIKDNLPVAGDWVIGCHVISLFLFFKRGVGFNVLSPVYPWPVRRYCQTPQNDTETAMAAYDSTTPSDICGGPGRLDRPTYKHVGKAFKTELPQQTNKKKKSWKQRHFNVQRGQHNAWEEECLSPLLIWKLSFRAHL